MAGVAKPATICFVGNSSHDLVKTADHIISFFVFVY